MTYFLFSIFQLIVTSNLLHIPDNNREILQRLHCITGLCNVFIVNMTAVMISENAVKARDVLRIFRTGFYMVRIFVRKMLMTIFGPYACKFLQNWVSRFFSDYVLIKNKNVHQNLLYVAAIYNHSQNILESYGGIINSMKFWYFPNIS